MAEDRKPLADELGIPFYGQLMGMATGTEEDLYDAAYISRQYGLESEFKDEDRTSDSLRHILLGGLVYGDDSKESILGQAGRGIAGALADFREGDTPEDLIDLNNNEFGRKLREKYPDREEFIAKAKEIADSLYADGELPEIDGISPLKSYGLFETPERLAKFEEENKKQVMERGPDGNWQFTEQAKKEREAAGLNKGGLMSARDLLEQIDVNSIPLTIDTLFDGDRKKVIDNPIAEQMDADLETAFINFYGSLREASDPKKLREQYSKAVRSVRDRDPEIFDQYFLGPNTDEKIQALNFEAFSDKPLPSTKEESEAATMNFNIPFGSEGDLNLGGANVNQLLRGSYIPKGVYGATEIFVPGFGLDREQARSGVLRHEGRHSFFDQAKDPSRIGDEESVVRQLDVLDAVISQDKEKLEAIFDIEYGQKLRKNPDNAEVYKDMFDRDVKQRLVHAVQNLPFLYDQGVFDTDKANKELIQKFLQDYDTDNQGVISSLLGTEPEKQKEVRATFDVTNLDSEQLAKALSTAPFAEADSPVGMYSVPYDIDREAAGMNEGGLMGDPLMLSETAEEENTQAREQAAQDYMKGLADVVSDFIPGVSQAKALAETSEAYDAGDFLGASIAAIGVLPGGKAASYAAKLADDVVEASQKIAKLNNYLPKKTVTAYKLVKEKNGKFYPLFVGQGKEKSDFPIGEWLKAEAGELTPKGKVKSSIGELAYRPGFHAGDLPIATHIGGKSSKEAIKPDYRPDNQVWVEIEMADDVDWGSEALKRAEKTKDGRIKSVTAHITDMVPHGGHYRYKTNPNMTGEWLIGGEMKVKRVLSDDEVKKINDAAGVADLPRKSELQKDAGGLMKDEYNRFES